MCVDDRADGLKHFAEIGLQNQEGEAELQAQPPEQIARLDGASLVEKRKPRDARLRPGRADP